MNYKEKQLIINIEKRLKTIMIGGLSRFEKSFGHLWNMNDDPINEQQEIMRDKWEDTRTDLLNHANHQMRLALEELTDYINYNNKYNYKYNFIMTDDTDPNRR